MANRDLVKSYTAEGAIPAARIVKFGAADYGVLQAAAVGDFLIGVSLPNIAAATGESCDVIHEGIAELQLGASVTRGALLTSDASGQGVVAAPAAGTNNRVIGVALVSGVSGDIIPVLISPGTFQG